MKTTRLRVVLCDVEPPLARVIDVPSKATLPELHDLLQAAIGWTNSHLHQFVTPEATYGMEIPGGDVLPEDQRDETAAQLADLGDRFEYLYDFGDGWAHDVEVLGPGGGTPGCVDGDGACPPEDCGGPGGYAELLDTLADPRHPEHDEMRAWVGDRLRPFNLAATDQRVRRVVGEVPESVRLLIDLVGNGLKLTPGSACPNPKRCTGCEAIEVRVRVQQRDTGTHARSCDQTVEALPAGYSSTSRSAIPLVRQLKIVQFGQTKDWEGAQMTLDVRRLTVRPQPLQDLGQADVG